MSRARPRLLAALALATSMLIAAPAAAQKAASIGTNPPGSVFYAIGSGLAKVVADTGAMQLAVQPYAGTSTFVPLLESGELDFGVNNAVDMGLVYRGPSFKIGGRNPFPAGPSLRLVMRGAPLMIAPVVRRDSPIKTVADMRGKRVTGEYPANLAIWYNIFGWLASAGMTWSDVRVVPVPALNDGIDALVQGRADVSSYALNGAKVREADAAVGVRHASIDCSPEGEKRLRAAVPGYYPRRVPKGGAVAVVDDMCAVAYDIYVVAGKGVSDALVEGVLRATWEHPDKLVPIHPIFKEWVRERLANAEVTMPYHPAAVRFFTERGVWKPEMDEAQQKLLSIKR
ncbi:MAG TPA: TAXI family TRAP transporter solute-binding subunit [Methylomirabilota bacterium]|nr:TAXI family TRAP transporter solute-binding subunit [Methylomirabilota bacterium]